MLGTIAIITEIILLGGAYLSIKVAERKEQLAIPHAIGFAVLYYLAATLAFSGDIAVQILFVLGSLIMGAEAIKQYFSL